MRLDKWIWAVRMAKTRSKATEHCKLGRVTINGQAAKPAKMIKVGDIIETNLPHGTKTYRVLGFIQKQASAERVAQFFEDLTPPPEEKIATATATGAVRKADKKEYEKRRYRKDQGKLTKKDRRKYEAFFE